MKHLIAGASLIIPRYTLVPPLEVGFNPAGSESLNTGQLPDTDPAEILFVKSRRQSARRNERELKSALNLADLDDSKSAVLNRLLSLNSRTTVASNEALPSGRMGQRVRRNGLGIERVSQTERCTAPTRTSSHASHYINKAA
jgi:hypothetical protein